MTGMNGEFAARSNARFNPGNEPLNLTSCHFCMKPLWGGDLSLVKPTTSWSVKWKYFRRTFLSMKWK